MWLCYIMNCIIHCLGLVIIIKVNPFFTMHLLKLVSSRDGQTQSTRCPTLHLLPPFCPTPSTVLKLFPSASSASASRSPFILILC